MLFGTNGGKWLHDKLTIFKEAMVREMDEEVERFIDKEYFYLMQISCVYIKLDKRHRALSIAYLIFTFSNLFYHYILLSRSSMLMMDLNMVLFSQSTHFTLLFQLSLIVIVHFQSKHRQIFLFHKMLSSGFFDYEEPPAPGEDALRATMVKERRLLSMIPIGVALSGGMVLIASPIVDKMVGSFDQETLSREFSTHLPYAYGKYPYQTKEGFSFYLALGGQLTVGFLLTAVIGMGGFLFLNLAQNVTLQLQLLQNSFDHLEGRAEDMYFHLFGKTKRNVQSLYEDHDFRYCYSTCLRKNFKHHQVILRAFHYTEEIMSVPIFVAYLTGTIVIALSLISAGSVKELPGTTVASMVLCGVEIGYMFLFSVFGQRLGDLNLDLRFKIYSTKWYLCNERVKSNLMLFQEKTLKPLTILAGGIVPANMETFATVMNSAYSYYNLVNAFGN